MADLDAQLSVVAEGLGAVDEELERRGVALTGDTTLAAESFAFMVDPTLKAIAARDYEELRVATRTVKARALLAGSVLEAVLMDALERSGLTSAQTDRMSFESLINEAERARLIGTRTAGVAHSLRDYRNLVHPAVERRDGRLLTEEADTAVSLLRLVLGDLR